jgi:hypothetical protein
MGAECKQCRERNSRQVKSKKGKTEKEIVLFAGDVF